MSIKILKCLHCNHEWPKRRNRSQPKVCPKCKSKNWDRPPQIKYIPKSKIISIKNDILPK